MENFFGYFLPSLPLRVAVGFLTLQEFFKKSLKKVAENNLRFQNWMYGGIHKPCGQRRGRGVPEKTMSVHKGEGVLEVGPRGQNFLYTTALNAVLLREFGVFI